LSGCEQWGQVWFHDLKKLLNTEMPRWRFANSPYLEEGKLIVDAGVIAALEPETGRVIWKTKNYGSAYSSAVVFDVHGRRCIVALPESGLVLLDAASGKELGFYPWETMYGINAATPVVHENKDLFLRDITRARHCWRWMTTFPYRKSELQRNEKSVECQCLLGGTSLRI
jgi:outer membrane protein assembly factor BamB